MKLVIDRKKWLRGEGADDSRLLRGSDGKMCCLGFLCLAHGVPAGVITGVPSPGGIRIARVPEAIEWLLDPGGDSDDCAALMRYNDAQTAWNTAAATSWTRTGNLDEIREREITQVFQRHDIEVEFIN